MHTYMFWYHVLRALLSSQEAPEDDPKLGVLSLKKVWDILECVSCVL